MSARIPRALSTAPLALAVVALVASLCGCSSPPTGSGSPTPELALSAPPLEGIGPTGYPGADFPIPAGARSVVVEFACDGGGDFAVELGDPMMLGQAPLEGSCDGTSPLAWPVSERTGGTLNVHVPDGVAWTATPAFSSDEFAADAALTADCAALSPLISALYNAEAGYQQSQLNLDEWSARMATVAGGLDAFAASSESALDAPGAALRALVADPALVPGTFITSRTDPLIEIRRACNTNQSPLVLMGEFGG
ncbi:MAG: hypothetical protein QM598_03725 [Protaetiibacter sp.]